AASTLRCDTERGESARETDDLVCREPGTASRSRDFPHQGENLRFSSDRVDTHECDRRTECFVLLGSHVEEVTNSTEREGRLFDGDTERGGRPDNRLREPFEVLGSDTQLVTESGNLRDFFERTGDAGGHLDQRVADAVDLRSRGGGLNRALDARERRLEIRTRLDRQC